MGSYPIASRQEFLKGNDEIKIVISLDGRRELTIINKRCPHRQFARHVKIRDLLTNLFNDLIP